MDFLCDYGEEEEQETPFHESEEKADDHDDEYGPKPVQQEIKEKKKKKKKKNPHQEVVEQEIQVVQSEEEMENFAKSKKIPISNEVRLVGHQKACLCISIEPAGNRLVTGSLDYALKIYDFGGMDSRCRAFNSLEPEEGHPVVSISHSPSGDRFIISTGSAQPIVYDREGVEIIKFVKGDMYLRDLTKTKGHVMEVTNVCWHPHEKNIIITSSLDGTVRVWDLTGEATFGCLMNKVVLKLRSLQQGTSRVQATCCTYSPDGSRILGGGADGSIQIWQEKRVYSTRPDSHLFWQEVQHQSVTNITVTPDNMKFAVRFESGKVALWSFQRLSGGSHSNVAPLWCLAEQPHLYPSANLFFNHDASYLLFCTARATASSSNSNNTNSNTSNNTTAATETTASRLHFFDLRSSLPLPSQDIITPAQPDHTPPKEVLSLAIPQKLVGIAVKWHPITNQIFVTLSNGEVQVLYNPELSRKGILLAIQKAPKREKDPSDYAVVGEIYTPFALNLYKEKTAKEKYIDRVLDLKNPVIAKIPQKPPTNGPGNRTNTSFFFTQYVTEGKQKDHLREEDPREALLKLQEKAEKEPIFFGRAYQQTQPKRLLAEMTFEQEREEFKKKQKTVGGSI